MSSLSIKHPLPLEWEVRQLKQSPPNSQKIEISILSDPCESYLLRYHISFPQDWMWQAGPSLQEHYCVQKDAEGI